MSSRVAIEVLSPKVPMVSYNMSHKVKVGSPTAESADQLKAVGYEDLGERHGYFSTGVNRQ